MQVDEDRLAVVAGLWARAALEPGLWEHAVAAVAALIEAPSGLLFNPSIDPLGRSQVALHGHIADGLRLYQDHFASQDPWFLAMTAQRVAHGAGTASVGRRYVSGADYRATSFYQDFGRHFGIHDAISLVICDESDSAAPSTRIAFHQPYGRDFTTDDLRVLRALSGSMQRAVQAYWLLRPTREQPRAAESSLDAVPHPTWVLQADGRVDYANAAARQHAGDWASFGSGRLVRVGDLDTAGLVRGTPASAAPGTVASVQGGVLRRATIHTVPVRDHPLYAMAWPHASVIVFLTLPHSDCATWIERFGRHHGLTPAEIRVLGLLADGLDLPEVAQRLDIGYGTVRTHMRRLLEKTGSLRQSDLMRRLFGAG